ncbi:MAG: hypothetical protein WKG01_22880 [Kofleriaceae bacterium]
MPTCRGCSVSVGGSARCMKQAYPQCTLVIRAINFRGTLTWHLRAR